MSSYRYEPEGANDPGGVAPALPWEDMVAAKIHAAISPPDPDPDRTFLGILRRELMTAAEREKEARAHIAEHTAKADALTREREAIERAIKAYQHQESPNIRADR